MHLSGLGKLIIGLTGFWVVTKAIQHDIQHTPEQLSGFPLLKHFALGGDWSRYNYQIDVMGFGTTSYEERCNLWNLYREGKIQ
jgi:hypothetical protein